MFVLPNAMDPPHLFPKSYPHHSFSYWEQVEAGQISSVLNQPEPFCEVNEHADPEMVAAFGSHRPRPDQYLLYYARGWDSNTHQTPLLLVHGAGLDASSFTNLWDLGYTGLQQQLTALGYRVFAVCFAHSHGDNFIHAEQLAAAITRVKESCGCDQINLLAHSKGGIAARIYLSGLGATPYRDDVNHYLMLGTPNLGTDFAFRNTRASYMIYLTDANGVIAWDKINVCGCFKDVSARAVYQDGCFPGQSQILYRWDERYPLDLAQPDWWTSYYGGWGFISHSRGIDQAIKDGGSLIEKVNAHPLPADITLSLLAGDHHLFWQWAPGENSGPSDGIVFVESALYTDGMTAGGAKVKAKAVLPVNHIQLLYHYKVSAWVDSQLKA